MNPEASAVINFPFLGNKIITIIIKHSPKDSYATLINRTNPKSLPFSLVQMKNY